MGTQQRHAWNEAVLSKLNGDLAAYDEAAGFGDARLDFVCECFRADCRVRLPMSAHEWEQIHREPDHYVVAPGHEDAPERERIVSRREKLWIVQKIGTTAQAAREARRALANKAQADDG